MAHTANNLMNVLVTVFGEWVQSQGLWPARLTNLNPCDLYGTQLRDKMYVNNSHSLWKWKKIFSRKFLLFQGNLTVCLEKPFQDVRPTHMQKTGTLRLYFELRQAILYMESEQ
jgi:hypothetical protein